MEELTPAPQPETTAKRTNLLTLLCILTFIGSGMNMVSSLFIAGFYDYFTEVAKVLAEKFNWPGIEAMLEVRPAFFLISGLFYASTIAGAVLMFRLKKVGFHIYTISQILLILAPMYFMNLRGPVFLDILFSGTFVLLYATQLKTMKG